MATPVLDQLDQALDAYRERYRRCPAFLRLGRQQRSQLFREVLSVTRDPRPPSHYADVKIERDWHDDVLEVV